MHYALMKMTGFFRRVAFNSFRSVHSLQNDTYPILATSRLLSHFPDNHGTLEVADSSTEIRDKRENRDRTTNFFRSDLLLESWLADRLRRSFMRGVDPDTWAPTILTSPPRTAPKRASISKGYRVDLESYRLRLAMKCTTQRSRATL